MVRVITQETYDDVVKENIEEFDMTPEEAVKEAIAQFQAQGVDLSNIIKDLALGSGEEHAVTTIVNKLRNLCSATEYDNEAVLQELDALKTECKKDIAHRVRAGKEGAYTILIDLLEARQKIYLQNASEADGRFIVSVLNTLTSLMNMQPDLLEAKGIDLIISLLDNTDSSEVLISTLKWTYHCCTKHEMNRQGLFGKNISKNLKTLLQYRKDVKVAVAAMRVIRKFTVDDDVRVQFGKAHEHAKVLATTSLLPLVILLKENSDVNEDDKQNDKDNAIPEGDKTQDKQNDEENTIPEGDKEEAIAEALKTISSLLVRYELCSLVADNGISLLLFTILLKYKREDIAQHACTLIAALAGNDDVKRKLMQAFIAPLIISILNKYIHNPKTVSQALKCISTLTLREASHAKQFFSCDAAEAIISSMKMHPDDATVQKNACWAIRNMVARYRDENSKFHELGAEELLNDAYKKFSDDFGFDIKSALRDLECDVKLEEQWKGKGKEIEK
ncbi:armadillo repeat-containing protein 6 homolog [Achroia grisella]|uniref:armadillo repeat-containing protein 6 homolog n=1 Tax=Achroia grisella TaxID=688607 RepID=UPI0027D275FC|nr:armadillo repeat-containing protein 6 homolog [Achroia grisella]